MTKKDGKIHIADEAQVAEFGGRQPQKEADETTANQGGEPTPEAVGESATVSAADPEPRVEDYKDRFLRAKAELQNVTRRAQSERAEIVRYANADLVRALLVVLDDIDRILESDHQPEDTGAILEGLRLVHQNYVKTLADFHVEPIEAAHVPFDPVIHEAMMQEPSDQHPADTVLRVVQKGYRLHDRVIRAAKVVVSPAAAPVSEGESPADSQSKSSPA